VRRGHAELHIQRSGEEGSRELATDRKRETDDQERLLPDKEKPVRPEPRHEAHAGSRKRAKETRSMERQGHRGDRARLYFTTRRIRIDPDKKRQNYITRLERIIRQCDRIISNPHGVEDVQIKAMSVLIKTIKVCYGLVVDVEVKSLEREVKELEEEERQLAGKRGEDELGYEITEDPPR
jgi:hypothetical protein